MRETAVMKPLPEDGLKNEGGGDHDGDGGFYGGEDVKKRAAICEVVEADESGIISACGRNDNAAVQSR